jgi:hypothetical protein
VKLTAVPTAPVADAVPVPVPVRVVVPEVNTTVEAVAAFAGTAENPAIANADAATSAMRLKLVFVDIFFLSRKVAEKNFSPAAWPKMPDS